MAEHVLARAMIAEILDSFEKLEIVMYLHRSGRPVSIEALATGVAAPQERIADGLAGLVGDGVVAAKGTDYELIAGGPWSAHVAELAELYRQDRIEIALLMSNAALDRMRSRATRAFADAFVIGRKKSRDD